MVNMAATKAEFDEIKSGNKFVVVDFTATWCGPCQMIAPKFAAIAGENPDVTFIKVDVDDNDETAAAEGIQCMPTFKFFKDGEEVDKLEGADEATIRSKVASLKA